MDDLVRYTLGMGYALEHREPVRDGIRRVMNEQLARGRDALDGVDDDPARAIHECRKRCKKIRGAIRLVRPAVAGDGYREINVLARDAGRELARFRDATAISATFDRLDRRMREAGVHSPAMRAASDALGERRATVEREPTNDHAAIGRATDLLAELGSRIEGLELSETGFDALGPGLAKTYGRGRAALARAVEAPTPDEFHDWRKRAKYTRYHVDLVASAAPALLGPLERSFHDLTDALGDAHDLAVIGEWLRSGEAARAGVDDAAARVLVSGAREELEWRAIALGERLYAEPPKRFRERMDVYWTTWTREESRRPAGDVDVAFG